LAPGLKGGDTVYAGSYAGGSENGRFAVISARGTHATAKGAAAAVPTTLPFAR